MFGEAFLLELEKIAMMGQAPSMGNNPGQVSAPYASGSAQSPGNTNAMAMGAQNQLPDVGKLPGMPKLMTPKDWGLDKMQPPAGATIAAPMANMNPTMGK